MSLLSTFDFLVIPLQYRALAAAGFTLAALGGGFYAGKHATTAIYQKEIAAARATIELVEKRERDALARLEKLNALSTQLEGAAVGATAERAAIMRELRILELKCISRPPLR